MARGSRKNLLDFGGNPHHVTLGYLSRVRVTVDVPRPARRNYVAVSHPPQHCVCFTGFLLTLKGLYRASAEVCSVLECRSSCNCAEVVYRGCLSATALSAGVASNVMLSCYTT